MAKTASKNALAGPAFRYAEPISAWPSITNCEPIPDEWKSRHNQSKAAVGGGMVYAVTEVLMGNVGFGRRGKTLSAQFRSSGRKGEVKVALAEGPQGDRGWNNALGQTGPSYLCLAEAVLLDWHDEVAERWQQLLNLLRATLRDEPPFSEAQLAAASHVAKHQMMALCDAMYFAISNGEKRGEITPCDLVGQPLPPVGFFPRPARQPGRTSSVRERLERLFKRGGTAILYGPTASFKTSLARAAAMAAGSCLVTLAGRKSVEDRDFLGELRLEGGDTRWVDGPVTEAFRKAQEGKVVLLLDEALRLESYHLNGLIPILDRYRPHELEAMGAHPLADGEHYVLKLPHERVVAPCSNLSVVLTSNVGANYLQPADQFDPALWSRIRLKIPVERPGRDLTEPIYRSVLDVDAVLEALYALEAYTAENTVKDAGLFTDGLNATTNLGFLEEVKAGLDEGSTPYQAFTEAAPYTLLEAVCPKDQYGRNDAAAEQLFRDEVMRVASALTN